MVEMMMTSKVYRSFTGAVSVLALLLLAAVAFILSVHDVEGASTRGQLNIQADVPPVLNYNVSNRLSQIMVTRSNIKRGYIKKEKATFITVTTNNINGYFITLSASEFPGISRITVMINDRFYILMPGSSIQIHMPYTGPKSVTKRLSYKFILNANAVEGIYPWPIMANVTPA